MSKYTTEVRFICESKSGLEVSGGSGDVDNVISKSWDKIFTSKAPFFDENYRSVLCRKILKHYYLREICCETVGIWVMWMNARLEELMPYYNQLYNSELIKFNPMYDVNLTREHKRDSTGQTTENGERTQTTKETRTQTTKETRTQTTKEIKKDDSTNTKSVTGNSDNNVNSNGTISDTNNNAGTKCDLYSDTPQGDITGLENGKYLTNARKITDNSAQNGNKQTTRVDKSGTDYTENTTINDTNNGTTDVSLNDTTNGNLNDTTNGNLNDTTTNNESVTSTEDYLEKIIGKQGTESYSTLLNKYRDTFLNIDMLVIEEFSDLFFGLW